MAQDRRYLYCRLCPGVPVVDVDVRPADPCFLDPDQYVIDADLGFRNVLKPKSHLGLALNDSFHFPPMAGPGTRLSNNNSQMFG